MSFAETALMIGMIGQSIAILVVVVKLVAWISAENATAKQRLLTLEYQVNNDITGRKAVSDMRNDVSVIKSQITDIKGHLSAIENKI